MKFFVTIRTSKSDTAKQQKIQGFTSLPDACTAAHAIARSHASNPDALCGVWSSTGPHNYNDCLGVTTHKYGEGAAAFTALAEIAFVKAKATRKEAKRIRQARQDWLDTHRGKVTIDTILANEPARQAFFKNEFAHLEELLLK